MIEKESKFDVDDDCLRAVGELKKKLVSAPITISPDRGQHFKVMCDTSGVALGVALEQRRENILYTIYHARKSFNMAQMNYTLTEQDLLAMVFAFEKFQSYLLRTKVIVHTNHSALRNLMDKKDTKSRLIRSIMLLQEFDW